MRFRTTGPLILVVLFYSFSLFAQTLETLDAQITNTDQLILKWTEEYGRENKKNKDRLTKIEKSTQGNDSKSMEKELQLAYGSAENLNQINLRINQLHQDKQKLCLSWHAAYRKTMDELLVLAGNEKDIKKKAQIGRKIQLFQARNTKLCADSQEARLPLDWRNIRVEAFDGPAEINQKVQLLKDISREVLIGLTKLETQRQNFQREQKTRELAEEMIQEADLFNEGVTIRRVPSGATRGPSETPGEFSPNSAVDNSTGGTTTTSGDLTGGSLDMRITDPIQFEQFYKKTAADLQSQQKRLQSMIQEFEQKVKEMKIP
jgi:hypothetical protein